MKTLLGIAVSIFSFIICVAVAFKFLLPNLHFGNGTGDSGGGVSWSSISTSQPSQSDLSKENKISEIRIEESDIYFNGELVDGVDNLTQKIIDAGTEQEYNFVYDNAIKGTYDKVSEALSELERALDITINKE